MKIKPLLLALCVGLSTSVVAASKETKRYTIKWQEQSNRILFDSVCYNYAEGSIPYRRCRAQAQKHFTQQCRDIVRQIQPNTGALQPEIQTEA